MNKIGGIKGEGKWGDELPRMEKPGLPGAKDADRFPPLAEEGPSHSKSHWGDVTPLPGTPVPQEEIDAIANPQRNALRPSSALLVKLARLVSEQSENSQCQDDPEVMAWLAAMAPLMSD